MNYEFIYLASATITSDTNGPEVHMPSGARGAVIIWTISAISGGGAHDARWLLQFYNPVAAAWFTNFTGTTQTAAATYYTVIHPNAADMSSGAGLGNDFLGFALPPRWRLSFDLVTATSLTHASAIIPLP